MWLDRERILHNLWRESAIPTEYLLGMLTRFPVPEEIVQILDLIRNASEGKETHMEDLMRLSSGLPGFQSKRIIQLAKL